MQHRGRRDPRRPPGPRSCPHRPDRTRTAHTLPRFRIHPGPSENPLTTTPTTAPAAANPDIDPAEEARKLRALAAGFTGLHTKLIQVPPTFDAAGLGWLVERIGDSQHLTTVALERLEHLTGTQLSAVPGHRATLECLAAVAQDTAGATLSLAAAVAAFPFEAAGFDPQTDAGAAHQIREHRHREARAVIREALKQAAHTMEVCETACHYSATALVRDTAALPAGSVSPVAAAHAPAPAANAPQPKLTPAQHAALRSITAGGATMYESGRNGPLRITAGAGVRITMPTYDRLQSLGFVGRDTSTGLYFGQKLYATDAGRTALAALSATAAPSPPAPAASPGARRR